VAENVLRHYWRVLLCSSIAIIVTNPYLLWHDGLSPLFTSLLVSKALRGYLSHRVYSLITFTVQTRLILAIALISIRRWRERTTSTRFRHRRQPTRRQSAECGEDHCSVVDWNSRCGEQSMARSEGARVGSQIDWEEKARVTKHTHHK